MREEYLKNIEEARQIQVKYEKWHTKLGYIKLIDIGLFLLCLYLTIKSVDFPKILLTIIFFEAYFLLMVVHHKAVQFLENAKRMERVFQDYIDRMDGNWTSFKDTGEEFKEKGHGYCEDIDILGKSSVFQLLNTAKTYLGRRFFAEDLLNPEQDCKEIDARQDAVIELSENLKFVTELQCFGSRVNKDLNMNNIINAIKGEKGQNKAGILDYITFVLPVFTVVVTVFSFILKRPELYIAFFVLFAAQALLWLFGMIKLFSYLGRIADENYKTRPYVEMFKLIEGRTFESPLLKNIKSKYIIGDKKASDAMEELSLIIGAINVKRHGILYFVLNLMLLWDYNCAFALKKWRVKYESHIEEWFTGIGHIESLMSFGTLKLIEEKVSIPSIKEGKKIVAEELGHPLINVKERVNNNVSLDDKIFIISGSNMSGKTTFLRTLGVNMVLGLNGGYVLASHMEIPVIGIISSMRNMDDLGEGTSTFYAELKKIKQILEEAEKGNVLFLIDEIFKGTNSTDRLKGAEAVIKKLDNFSAIGLITTHDLELCNIEDGKRIKNYSFKESYESGRIHFDYILREGKSESTNAKYLMEMLGIV
ncbi:MutS-related protein [Anaeropeptidivorans aminofermentans]|jgi:hypothetical protein|uniref:MutS-related protein n=1 Tax=Anaeropeptidivorans aminofermentans TaxID=2934315 RepID=UPI0020242762|nr:hypothetical protein [Anaeropeptidivorans aminofermentans]MBE6013434.1 hypothetical protein [Lachnospiraceae bacterium]